MPQSLLPRRDVLNQKFKDIEGVKMVAFQPPNNLAMDFPCITYIEDDAETQFADNSPYYRTTRYQVTVIDEDSDSSIAATVAQFPMCRFVRRFVSDDLHHSVYQLFF